MCQVKGSHHHSPKEHGWSLCAKLPNKWVGGKNVGITSTSCTVGLAGKAEFSFLAKCFLGLAPQNFFYFITTQNSWLLLRLEKKIYMM